MRLSRKELVWRLEEETRAREVAQLCKKLDREEISRLQCRLAEQAEENNKLRMVMSSNAKEICRLRNMMHQQINAKEAAARESDKPIRYLLREDVLKTMKHHAKSSGDRWRDFSRLAADICALPSYKPRVKESDEYIDGYADAMQDMEKFLEEKKNLRAEVGSDH